MLELLLSTSASLNPTFTRQAKPINTTLDPLRRHSAGQRLNCALRRGMMPGLS